MNPEHLKTFLAVRKHLNFTRAAEELYLSQPAVSRQIQRLSEDLSAALFEQIGKSLHLTDAGRTLVPLAEDLLGRMDRVAEVVSAHRGQLRIGASTTPGLNLLPPALGQFHRTYPDVELRYSVENSSSIEHKIVRNELDLGFVGGPVSNGDLHSGKIADDEIICFASSTHPLAKRRRIDAPSLRDQTWVIREKGSATRQLFEQWLSTAGGRIERMIELESPEAIKALVKVGIGISFMSAHGVRGEIERRRIKRLAVTGLRLTRPIFLVRHPDKHVSPAMNAFLSLVRCGGQNAGRVASPGQAGMPAM